MCKVAVLFSDPNSPGIIRIVLGKHAPKFYQIDAKGVHEQIKSINPLPIVALDATCPKKSKRILNQLPPGIQVMYVGGTNEQQRQMSEFNCQPGWKAVQDQL